MSEVLVTVAQVGAVGHVVGQLALWVDVIVVVVGGKKILNVEVTVLKMSVVISVVLVTVSVAQIGEVGHEVGQLVLWVVVTVVGEHDGNVGHECGLECDPECEPEWQCSMVVVKFPGMV
jgi:uncharacterized Tic20 family protein